MEILISLRYNLHFLDSRFDFHESALPIFLDPGFSFRVYQNLIESMDFMDIHVSTFN